MSLFIHTADWHLHPWRDCSNDAGADRLADGLHAVRQILEAATARHCPVVFAGDMKQIRGTWPVAVLNGVLALFREFHDVQCYAIPGNHDGRTGAQSGLDALNELSNFHLFDTPTIHPAPWGDNERVAYWPWQPTLDTLPEFLKDAKRDRARALIAHTFLSGATVGADYVVPTGKGAATLQQFGLTPDNPVFEVGFFGDVHRAQSLGSAVRTPAWRSAAFYCGSPLGLNWGETESNKGALLVDTTTRRVQSLLIQAPRFQVADLTIAASYRAALKGVAWNGDFVRVLVRPEAKPAELEAIRQRSGARIFQVVVQRAPRTEQRANVHAAMPVGEILAEYVKARPPADGLDSAVLLEAGKRLLG